MRLIINLTVKDILSDFKESSNRAEANKASDNLRDGSYFAPETALDKFRILALWIQRSQRRVIEDGLAYENRSLGSFGFKLTSLLPPGKIGHVGSR
jgi:hypothetical protein